MATQGKKPSEGIPQKDHLTPDGSINTEKSECVTPLNFKVDGEFAREFKVFAAMNNKKLVEVFRESFLFYKQHHGG